MLDVTIIALVSSNGKKLELDFAFTSQIKGLVYGKKVKKLVFLCYVESGF